MTKPRNFPGRKHQRRIEALDRMNASDGVKTPAYPSREEEKNVLRERISKGGIRKTKKNRGL